MQYNDHGAPSLPTGKQLMDNDIPLAYGMPMAPPDQQQQQQSQPPPLSTSARSVMTEQGYTNGLQDAFETNQKHFRQSYWIVDNSGSMATPDGNRILETKRGRQLKFASCTRWREMQDTVDYHAQLATLTQSPTEFRLLNDPGAAAGPQRFRVGDTTSDNDAALALAQSVMLNAQPGGVTPLTQHLHDIRNDILNSGSQHKIAIVLATDGVPTDARGYSDAFCKQQFVDALRSLMALPVWVVVRLCTDETEVVDYWNALDEDVELNLEILDDYNAEAEEVVECNRWLNYGLPLHRLRELGFHHRTFDLLDERRLSKGELRDFLRLLLGSGPMAEAPDPDADWKGFCDAVSRLLAKEKKQWNPITKRLEPWIDMKKLNKDFGHGGLYGLFA